jgi:hypothetical protein
MFVFPVDTFLAKCLKHLFNKYVVVSWFKKWPFSIPRVACALGKPPQSCAWLHLDLYLVWGMEPQEWNSYSLQDSVSVTKDTKPI